MIYIKTRANDSHRGWCLINVIEIIREFYEADRSLYVSLLVTDTQEEMKYPLLCGAENFISGIIFCGGN